MKSRLGRCAARVAVVAALFLSLGGFAYAQTPAMDQYGTKVKGAAVTETQQQTPASAVDAEQSGLPNTGLSLLGTVLVGGALVGVGLALRRRERESDGRR